MISMIQVCTASLTVIVALSLLGGTGAISCNLVSQLQPSEDVICPNESLLLECRVKDRFGGRARTIIEAGTDCTLVLPHSLVNENRTDDCGIFKAQLLSPPTRNCFSSTLRASVTSDYDETVITCRGPRETTVVDNYTVNIAGRPAAPKVEIKVEDIREGPTTSTNRVTIHWTSDGVRLSHHIISVSPPPLEEPCSNGTCSVDPQVTELELVLYQNQQYIVTVRTDNCGDSQQGDTSHPLEFQLEVPSQPIDCKFHRVYDGATGRLTHIEATWNHPPNLEEQTTLPTAITNYTVTAQFFSAGTLEVTDTYEGNTTSNCGGVCSLTINIDPALSSGSSSVIVMVAAINSVGTGAFCQEQPISMDINDMASVDTKGLGVEKWTVDFRFKTTSPKPPYHQCTFMYGTDASYSDLQYCVECSNNTSYGIYTVTLTGRLMSNVTYFFQAIIDENRVQGNFTTAQYYCPLEALAKSFELDTITDANCNDSRSSLRIPHGVICINDTIPTYEARYICDEHYTMFPLKQNSSRVCMTDRHWSGGVITCKKGNTLPSEMRVVSTKPAAVRACQGWTITWIVIAIMVAVTVLLLAYFTGSLVILVCLIVRNWESVTTGCSRCLKNNSATQKRTH